MATIPCLADTSLASAVPNAPIVINAAVCMVELTWNIVLIDRSQLSHPLSGKHLGRDDVMDTSIPASNAINKRPRDDNSTNINGINAETDTECVNRL